MKKTEISKIPYTLPEDLDRLTRGARLFDSSSSTEARVYFIDRDGGYYLKIAPSGVLEREAVMTEYFHKKGLSAKLLSYISGENDIMLTSAVAGDDCTTARYLAEPKRLATFLGERLRMLHEIDPSDCPVADRVDEYISLAEGNYRSDNYNKEHFPDSFGYASGEEAFSALCRGKKLLKNEVLIHGDYCLPNLMLRDWEFTGFIDLGNAGIGDRHIDLFWGRWSLEFNLSKVGISERVDGIFFDSYGRDKINEETLLTVSAAEVFG